MKAFVQSRALIIFFVLAVLIALVSMAIRATDPDSLGVALREIFAANQKADIITGIQYSLETPVLWNAILFPAAPTIAALIVFALVVYPVWSACAGHPYPAAPTFGLPCPTTIFTIGLLCFAVPPTPRSPLIVLLLSCLAGTQAAFFLGVQPDVGHFAAGAVSVALLSTAGLQLRTLKS